MSIVLFPFLLCGSRILIDMPSWISSPHPRKKTKSWELICIAAAEAISHFCVNTIIPWCVIGRQGSACAWCMILRRLLWVQEVSHSVIICLQCILLPLRPPPVCHAVFSPRDQGHHASAFVQRSPTATGRIARDGPTVGTTVLWLMIWEEFVRNCM